MKKMKKVLAMILSLAMVFAMSLTAFAETNENAVGTQNDKVNVKITGLTGGETITLYQIAKGNYVGTGEHAFKDYTWATGIGEEIIKKAEGAGKEGAANLSSSDITGIVNGITAETPTIVPLGTKTGNGENGTYTEEVGVGAYIAVITGATDGSVYNPIYLTATYDASGNLVGGEILASDKTMYGSEAVAKKTSPDIKKEITDGTTKDPSDTTKDTASVGDVLTYKITPTVPSYPKNAKNKTLFVADTMSEGLTYDPSSLTINVGTESVKADATGIFTYNGKEIAKLTSTDNMNGFYLNFNYENILVDADNNRTPYDLEVVYSARLNENAIVGNPGNNNDAKMYYANDPTKGSTFEPDDEHPTPDGAEGVTKKEDKKIVYTYKIAFRKTDSANKNKVLAGAVFGIYSDKDCTELVDVVTTNSVKDDEGNEVGGYAVSTRVKAGEYYIKEIAAPEGYSLDTTVRGPIKAEWTSMTTTSKVEASTTKYTTEKDKAVEPKVQVGWIKDGVFYQKQVEGAQPAYVEETSTTTSETSDFTENAGAGAGTNLFDKEVPNTQMSSLPSTGGIGTTIFTIGGCIIMIIAAGLFFASRRKKAEN